MSSDLALVIDIRRSAELIREYFSGLTQESFGQSWLIRDAAAFRPPIIGEAVQRLSPEIKASLPDIDWRGMVGLRHRLAHDYGSTNFSVLWTIVSEDVPALALALGAL